MWPPSRKRAREPLVAIAATPSPRFQKRTTGKRRMQSILERECSEFLSDSENELDSDDQTLKEPDIKKWFVPSEGVQQLLPH